MPQQRVQGERTDAPLLLLNNKTASNKAGGLWWFLSIPSIFCDLYNYVSVMPTSFIIMPISLQEQLRKQSIHCLQARSNALAKGQGRDRDVPEKQKHRDSISSLLQTMMTSNLDNHPQRKNREEKKKYKLFSF